MNCLLKVFDLSSDLIAISSLSGVIEVVNPAFRQALGHPVDFVKGKNITSLFHHEDAIYAQQALERMESKQPPIELRMQDHKGQYRWVKLEIHLSTEDRKRIFLAKDISAEKRIKGALRQSIPMEEHRQELNKFNHLLSHDIKEPIRNIVSFSNLALREIPANSKLEEYFQFIIQNGKQLQLLINNLLTYNLIDRQEELPLCYFDLHLLMDRLRIRLGEVMKEKKGRLLYSELPKIYGNEQLTFMLFKQLFENGFLYNESTRPEVEVTYEHTSRYHQFLITDNGIGIESEFHHYIFDLFKRLHNRQDYRGTGIGLATVRKILDKMDGEIKVLQSRPGEGSAFLVRIPVLRPAQEPPTENPMSKPPAILAAE